MIRSSLLVIAVAALGLTFAASAQAGGAGGGTKGKSNVAVWIKNIGAQTVQVNAQSGSAVTLAGGTSLATNGKKQFTVSSGQFSAIVRGTTAGTVGSNLFDSRGSSAVYLYAQADSKAATITVGQPF